MKSASIAPIEKLRRIWTPGREIEELVHKLDPATELDSMIRDFLHRAVQQAGPVTLNLDVPNTGNLRFEIIHFESMPGVVQHREVSLWVEE